MMNSQKDGESILPNFVFFSFSDFRCQDCEFLPNEKFTVKWPSFISKKWENLMQQKLDKIDWIVDVNLDKKNRQRAKTHS